MATELCWECPVCEVEVECCPCPHCASFEVESVWDDGVRIPATDVETPEPVRAEGDDR